MLTSDEIAVLLMNGIYPSVYLSSVLCTLVKTSPREATAEDCPCFGFPSQHTQSLISCMPSLKYSSTLLIPFTGDLPMSTILTSPALIHSSQTHPYLFSSPVQTISEHHTSLTQPLHNPLLWLSTFSIPS